MRTIVGVKFDDRGTLSEKTYCYFTDIENLLVGDWVVVVVNHTPKTAVVTLTSGISKSDRDKACKWIVSKIDLHEYELKLKKQELISEIENELDEQMQKVQRYEMFKMCAKSSPKMQELLKSLSDLDPSICLIEEPK